MMTEHVDLAEHETDQDIDPEKIDGTIETTIFTAVRSTIAAIRFSQRRENMIDSANPLGAGGFFFAHDGESSMLAGEGEVFRRFLQTRQLTGYPGEGTPIVSMFDPNCLEAPLKLVRFDQAFKKLPYDARHHAMYNPVLDTVLKNSKGQKGGKKDNVNKANDHDDDNDDDECGRPNGGSGSQVSVSVQVGAVVESSSKKGKKKIPFAARKRASSGGMANAVTPKDKVTIAAKSVQLPLKKRKVLKEVHVAENTVKRGRGRPKGSKNKKNKKTESPPDKPSGKENEEVPYEDAVCDVQVDSTNDGECQEVSANESQLQSIADLLANLLKDQNVEEYYTKQPTLEDCSFEDFGYCSQNVNSANVSFSDI